MVGSLPPPFHGSTVFFESIVRSDLCSDFEVRHLDTSDHRGIDNIDRMEIVNVFLAIRSIVLLAVLLLRWKPDLVYIPIAASFLPYLRDGIMILSVAALSSAKTVIHLHGGWHFRDSFFQQSRGFIRLFIRSTLKRVHTAIVLSNRFVGIFEGLVSRVEVVPNGIATNGTCAPRSTLLPEKSRRVVGFLGNLFESKGVLDLVLAAKQVLPSSSQDVVFIVAGLWPMQESQIQQEICRIIPEAGLEERILFRGALVGREKAMFLNEIDILAFPTWYAYEGMPLVILEAMAAGKAVVSSRGIGAIEDMVEHGVTGMLVPPRSPSELANALRYLLGDDLRRIAMGKAGRERFMRRYTMTHCVDRLRQVFRSVVS